MRNFFSAFIGAIIVLCVIVLAIFSSRIRALLGEGLDEIISVAEWEN